MSAVKTLFQNSVKKVTRSCSLGRCRSPETIMFLKELVSSIVQSHLWYKVRYIMSGFTINYHFGRWLVSLGVCSGFSPCIVTSPQPAWDGG